MKWCEITPERVKPSALKSHNFLMTVITEPTANPIIHIINTALKPHPKTAKRASDVTPQAAGSNDSIAV